MDACEPGTDLVERTQQFALRVIRLCEHLPARPAARVVGNQLLRSGTSVGANYRAARRARSNPDFSSKIGIVLEEADESAFWLQLIIRAGLLPEPKVGPLLQEAEELVAIFAASRITSLKRNKSRATGAS